MICGHCKSRDVTAAHVKGCSSPATVKTVQVSGYVKFDWKSVPEGRYAIFDEIVADLPVYRFYQVRRPDKGKWAGFTFIDRLYGAPGSYHKVAIKAGLKREIAEWLAENWLDAAQTYGRVSDHCGRCGAPLTDPVSLDVGVGPDCRKYPGWDEYKEKVNV